MSNQSGQPESSSAAQKRQREDSTGSAASESAFLQRLKCEVVYPSPRVTRELPVFGTVWLQELSLEWPMDPPPVPRGISPYWAESPGFRKFCSMVKIQILGGDAKGAYCQWVFEFGSPAGMVAAFLTHLRMYESNRKELAEWVKSTKPSKPQPILVEKRFGDHHLGYYLSKAVRREPAAMALAIQLLGRQ